MNVVAIGFVHKCVCANINTYMILYLFFFIIIWCAGFCQRIDLNQRHSPIWGLICIYYEYIQYIIHAMASSVGRVVQCDSMYSAKKKCAGQYYVCVFMTIDTLYIVYAVVSSHLGHNINAHKTTKCSEWAN